MCRNRPGFVPGVTDLGKSLVGGGGGRAWVVRYEASARPRRPVVAVRVGEREERSLRISSGTLFYPEAELCGMRTLRGQALIKGNSAQHEYPFLRAGSRAGELTVGPLAEVQNTFQKRV